MLADPFVGEPTMNCGKRPYARRMGFCWCVNVHQPLACEDRTHQRQTLPCAMLLCRIPRAQMIWRDNLRIFKGCFLARAAQVNPMYLRRPVGVMSRADGDELCSLQPGVALVADRSNTAHT